MTKNQQLSADVREYAESRGAFLMAARGIRQTGDKSSLAERLSGVFRREI
jgi:hypothetical protein